MLTGLALVLSCPFCGGRKEVMNVVSGNTGGGTLWSDGRRVYPMWPKVSIVHKCPHCGKYYFIIDAGHEYSDDPESRSRSFGELGNLTYAELKEARAQLDTPSLGDVSRFFLCVEILLAYNDEYHREPDSPEPSAEDEAYFEEVADIVLHGIKGDPSYYPIYADLLRETGRFKEATCFLEEHRIPKNAWFVEVQLREIAKGNRRPIKLVDRGRPVVGEALN